MARSLLRQLEQIRNTADYDSNVTGVYTSAVSEPTQSGTLEGDMNSLRTIVNELKGSTNWFDDLGNYFDPTSTDAAGTLLNKDLTLTNIKGNTVDSKTVIIAVTSSGHVVASGTTGALLTTSTAYATDSNWTGLPIFASTPNYHDEGGSDAVCRVDVINTATEGSFENAAGDIVYAKLHNGANNGGAGTGTDVYVKFYANDAAYTLDGADPTNVTFIYPVRRQMSAMAEHEWLRTDFVSGWEGDFELIEDISNLWAYTGSGDGVSSTAGAWSHYTLQYILNSSPSSLFTAVDLLNTGIGDRDYGNEYNITNGDSISDSLQDLDEAVHALSVGAVTKYVESVTTMIHKNVAHATPANYTQDTGTVGYAQNMDVLVDGQLLAASTGVNGAMADRDYAETSTSTITFHFNVHVGQNVTYMIRQ